MMIDLDDYEDWKKWSEKNMSGVNKVILVGRLGRDPELKHTNSGTAVCRLSVATDRVWYDKENTKHEETEWHRVTVWATAAENCAKFLEKGRQVYVEGRLQTTSYEKDGEKKYSTEIVADTVQFLGGKGGGKTDGGDSWGDAPSGEDKPDDTIPF